MRVGAVILVLLALVAAGWLLIAVTVWLAIEGGWIRAAAGFSIGTAALVALAKAPVQ